MICVSEIVLYLYLFCCIGLGPSFIIKYRMGNLMISDIALLLLFLFIMMDKMIHKKFTLKIKITSLLFLFVILSQLIFGFLNNYALDNILKDLKLVFYFIVPYMFISNNKNNPKFLKRLLIVSIFMGIFVSMEQFLQFFNITNQSFYEGNITRNVGIMVQFIPIISVALTYLRHIKLLKLKYLFYLSIQIMFLLACIFSMTRSVWIQYMLTYIIYIGYILYKEFQKITIKHIMAFASILMLILFIILFIYHNYNYLYSHYIIFEKMSDRLLSLKTINDNFSDTLMYRIEDIKAMLYKFNNITILWGYGLGDTRVARVLDDVCFTENSVIYYLWKYGVICNLILYIVVIKKVLLFFREDNSISKIILLGLLIFAIIGNFSGNLNLYYCMPMLSILCLNNVNEVVS